VERNCERERGVVSDVANECHEETADKVAEDGHTVHRIRRSFVQLSGHPGCFAPAGPITLWKKQAEGSSEGTV